jgi:hypothetical protein
MSVSASAANARVSTGSRTSSSDEKADAAIMNLPFKRAGEPLPRISEARLASVLRPSNEDIVTPLSGAPG